MLFVLAALVKFQLSTSNGRYHPENDECVPYFA